MYCSACGKENVEDAQFCSICGASLTSGETSIGTELPMVSIAAAINLGFSKYITFSGRATRAEFWWWCLFAFVLTLIPLAVFVVLIPCWAVTARRLHDIGKSGWLQIIPWAIFFGALAVAAVVGDEGLLFVIGMIAAFASFVVLTVWLVLKGDEGSNKYGPDPRRHTPQ